MQFSHDKHQYFFEKFLRHEMKGDELEAFKLRLSEDEEFSRSFDFYVANRKGILEGELAEYDEPVLLRKKPKKWGWFYAIISIFCIVLIADYYLTINYNASLEASAKHKPLIEKINIFRKDPQAQPTAPEKKVKPGFEVGSDPEPADSSEIYEEVDETFMQYLEGNRLAIQGDYFISDSLFKVVDRNEFSSKLEAVRMQTDSMLEDSTMNGLVMKSIYRNPGQIKRQLLVEFWGSPIHFRGYLFNGKKLILYGLENESPIYLDFEDNGNIYHLFVKNREYHLFANNQFNKLAD